jgi:hypothetical protein
MRLRAQEKTMVKMFVFNKATAIVVAILVGPDGVSCEHFAGHTDSSGKQPYCSPELGWQFEKLDANGEALPAHTLVPRVIGDGEMVNPRLVYEHKHEGVVVGRYLRKLTKAQLKSTDEIKDVNLEHDQVDLVLPKDVPVIEVAQFDHEGEIGQPGGPHIMTQEQFAAHLRQQAEENSKLATKHGLKVNK